MLIYLDNMQSDILIHLEENLFTKNTKPSSQFEYHQSLVHSSCKQSYCVRMTKMQLASQKLIHTTSTPEFHIHLHLPMEPKNLILHTWLLDDCCILMWVGECIIMIMCMHALVCTCISVILAQKNWPFTLVMVEAMYHCLCTQCIQSYMIGFESHTIIRHL